MPIGHMSQYVTFAPSMDDTLRTSFPEGVRIALRSHKALFYQRGLGPECLLFNPADPNGTFPTGAADLALPTLGGLGPPSHGTPENGLRRDCGHPSPESLHGSPDCCIILRLTQPTATARYRG